jgi:hypothetical protein
MGALKRLSVDHGEVKSMHTAQFMRGRGVGTAMLRHIIGEIGITKQPSNLISSDIRRH